MVDFSKHRLLVISPHPDDEVLGCGGLMHKVKGLGGKVFVLFLTVGDTVDFSQKGRSTSSERLDEIEKVAEYMDFDDYDLGFSGNGHHLKLDVYGQKELMDLIERRSKVAIETIKPTIVAFPSAFSYNQDHRMAAAATQAALRPAELTTKHMVELVLAYEVPADGWRMYSHPEPNFFVKLSDKDIEYKIEALRMYESQLRPRPNPRALDIVKALAQLRGSQSGSEYAEGYATLRNLS